MGLRFQQWLPIGLAGFLFLLVVANIVLILGNADRQREVNSRQALIQQAQQVDLPLYRELAQALADLAHRGDAQIAYMLTAQGIQMKDAQTPAAQPATGQDVPAAPASQPDPSRMRGRPQAPAIPPGKP